MVCTGKLGSLVETHVYLVGQVDRDPCWVPGSGQLLVIGSTELITIKSVEMPVPSKLGLASTIGAWWRHLHQWLRLPVCLVRTDVPFSYCISLCYVSYFFMFPLIPFPPSSSVPLCPYDPHDSSVWIKTWRDFICTRVLLQDVCLETCSKEFWEISRCSFNISLSFPGATRLFSLVVLGLRPGGSSFPTHVSWSHLSVPALIIQR